MKTKTIILIAITALATLSFTIAKTKKTSSVNESKITSSKLSQEPIGGFGAEDKL